MMDPRMRVLAERLIHYCCSLGEGERVLIEAHDVPEDFTVELIRQARRAGALPFVNVRQGRVVKALYEAASVPWTQLWADMDLHCMKQMDAYIGVRGAYNIAELSDVDPEQLKVINTHYFRPVHLEQRVRHTKWVVLRWPTPSMAQQADMSTEGFGDFFFKVCNLDYSRLSEAMDPLVRLMERTDQVRISGPGTDLRFSIKGIPVIKCDGKHNLPDGEVFTAPVKGSVQGTVQYNTPTIYQGQSFNNIRFRFENGRIVEATASGELETRRLKRLLDSDEGARYIGEFALGVNPFITQPMKDILFDEKIMGSIHLTPGQSYEEADNGNRSQIHWDLVLIQTEAYGGGRIYFDDELVRENGRFVSPRLLALNPEAFEAESA